MIKIDTYGVINYSGLSKSAAAIYSGGQMDKNEIHKFVFPMIAFNSATINCAAIVGIAFVRITVGKA